MTAWQLAKLEEVAQITGGGTPSRQEPSYFGDGIAWATPTDVTALKTLFIEKTKESITQTGLDNSSAKLLPKGAVLLTSRATIGFTAVATGPICTNQGFVNFVCGERLVPEFLAYWLRTQKEKMIQQAGGTTFKEIGRGALRKFEIPVPPMAEQHRIVDILSRAESIVRLRREAQQKAAELVPAIFLDMFGDPATNPKGLQTARIEDLCTLVRGSSPRPQGDPQYFGGPVPRLMIADITRDGVYVTPRIDSLTELGATKSRPMKAGEVVMAVSGAVGLPALLAVDACIHDGFVGFRDLDPSVSPEFFYSYLSVVRQRSASQAVGATFQNLKTDQVKEWLVPIPTPGQQQNFLDVVSRVRSIHTQQIESSRKAESTLESLLNASFNSQANGPGSQGGGLA